MNKRLRNQMAVFVSVIVATGGLAVTPAKADPDALSEARAKLAQLQQESSAIDAQLIDAANDLDDASAKLKQLAGDISKQQTKVDGLKSDMGRIALYQVQTGGVNATAQLLSAEDTTKFLSSLAAMDAMEQRTNQSLQGFQAEQGKLNALKADQEATVAHATAARDKSAALAKDYDAKEAEAKAVVTRLTAEQRARLEAEQRAREAEERRQAEAAAVVLSRSEANRTSRDTNRPAADPQPSDPEPEPSDPGDGGSTSDRAMRAVQIARAQTGKSYVWGTSGPSTFDCSGLTSYAYRQVGISLSRSSKVQAGQGSRVSRGDIRPGDLVFYYFPVSHVGMYIGNGMIVHAANPRRGVRIAGLDSMPINSIRRVA